MCRDLPGDNGGLKGKIIFTTLEKKGPRISTFLAFFSTQFEGFDGRYKRYFLFFFLVWRWGLGGSAGTRGFPSPCFNCITATCFCNVQPEEFSYNL